METFWKAFGWALAGGTMLFGFLCGLVVLKVMLGVVAAMLGSGVGTLVLAVFIWSFYKSWKKRQNE